MITRRGVLAGGLSLLPAAAMADGFMPRMGGRNGFANVLPAAVRKLSPALWLRADRPLITLNGTTVSAWRDLSSNRSNASQSTEASQPTYDADAIGGRPGLVFDGSADFLKTDGFSAISALTLAFVIEPNRLGHSGNQDVLVRWGTQNQFILRITTGDQWDFIWNDGTTRRITAGSPTLNTPSIIVARVQAGQQDLRENGTSIGSSTLAGALSTSTDDLYIGQFSNSTNQSAVTIPEAVIVNGYLSDAGVVAFENYVTARYGL